MKYWRNSFKFADFSLIMLTLLKLNICLIISRVTRLKDIYYLLIELFNGETFNSIYVMDTIDISQNIQDFKQVFEKRE